MAAATSRFLPALLVVGALALTGCLFDSHKDHDHKHGHGEGPAKMYLIDRAADHAEVADTHGDHWHGSLREIKLGEHISVGARFVDEDGDDLPLTGDYSLRARLADGAPDSVVGFVFHGDHLHLQGLAIGETQVIFQYWHDGHADWETPALTVTVSEDGQAPGEGGQGGHDHDHD